MFNRDTFNTNQINQYHAKSMRSGLEWSWCVYLLMECGLAEGRFTPWTMKADHEIWLFSMVRLDGPTSMIPFLKKSNYKAFGPLTRCKLNVDQEE